MDYRLMALLGSPEQARKTSFEDMYHHLASPVLSHSHRFRLKALQVLSSPLVRMDPTQELVISKLLQAEEVPIDAQSSRERVLRVTQLERVIPPGDTVVSELAVCWLVAQLKVGLRPVWLPTAQALEKLSERCAETVWRVMFGELKAAIVSSSVDHVPDWMKDVNDGPCNADEVREGERSWRDPSAHKIRSVLAKWRAQDTSRLHLIQVCSAHRFARDPPNVCNVGSATPRPIRPPRV
jgi:U3 small nucleolar RNA-associated protein 20